MKLTFKDQAFSFELLRAVGYAPYPGEAARDQRPRGVSPRIQLLPNSRVLPAHRPD